MKRSSFCLAALWLAGVSSVPVAALELAKLSIADIIADINADIIADIKAAFVDVEVPGRGGFSARGWTSTGRCGLASSRRG